MGTAIDADTDALRELSDPEPTEIAGLLEDDPVMSLLEKRALARLLSCAIIKRLPAESPIFASGEPAAELIFVITGMIEIIVPNREAIALEGSRFGDEAALATGRYAMSARTRSEAMLVVIPRRALTAAVAENTAARNAFEIAVLDRLSSLPQKRPPRHRHHVGSAVPRTATLGWLLTVLAPIAILLFVPRAAVGHDATSFLAILSAVICLWGFGLVEEFIPGLFMLCAILAIGIVPPAVALSGFSSDGFFMTLGILALGGTISSSGLSYRLLLWMLAKLPDGPVLAESGHFGGRHRSHPAHSEHQWPGCDGRAVRSRYDRSVRLETVWSGKRAPRHHRVHQRYRPLQRVHDRKADESGRA